MVSVIINDYVLDRRVNIMLDSEDFIVADRLMTSHDDDYLLLQLQEVREFKGRTRLRDLEPYHLRLMITLNLSKIAMKPKADGFDLSDPIVKSLVLLISILIRCLEKRCDADIELLKLNRVGALDVCVEFSAMMSMDEPPKFKKSKTKDSKKKMTVIVDNT